MNKYPQKNLLGNSLTKRFYNLPSYFAFTFASKPSDPALYFVAQGYSSPSKPSDQSRGLKQKMY